MRGGGILTNARNKTHVEKSSWTLRDVQVEEEEEKREKTCMSHLWSYCLPYIKEPPPPPPFAAGWKCESTCVDWAASPRLPTYMHQQEAARRRCAPGEAAAAVHKKEVEEEYQGDGGECFGRCVRFFFFFSFFFFQGLGGDGWSGVMGWPAPIYKK